MDPERIVREFCAAFASRDPQKLLGYLAPDAVYHNLPLAPVTGHAAIEGVLRGFLAPCTGCEFEMRAVARSGSTVLTERIDRFTRADGKRIELPVMGAFEVGPDGKIRAWRDYFDLATWTRQAG
jgi:limonene-1,2-epoxide hydrolase